jgi:hypothetical protein
MEHRALNQFTFFKEVLSGIYTHDILITKQNKQYLEVAIDSIRALEKAKQALRSQ